MQFLFSVDNMPENSKDIIWISMGFDYRPRPEILEIWRGLSSEQRDKMWEIYSDSLWNAFENYRNEYAEQLLSCGVLHPDELYYCFYYWTINKENK